MNFGGYIAAARVRRDLAVTTLVTLVAFIGVGAD